MARSTTRFGRRRLLALGAVACAGATLAACDRLPTTARSADARSVLDVDLVADPPRGERRAPEFHFEPVGLLVGVGQTVRFNARSAHHTVTVYHGQQGKTQRAPEGSEPFSSPVLPVGGSWAYTFTRPGVYDLWCAPHEQLGMAMRLVVGEPTGPGAAPSTDLGPRGTYGAAGAVLADPALAPERIVARGRVGWAELDPRSKTVPERAGG